MAYAGKLTYKTELDTSGVQKAGSTVKSIIAGLGIAKAINIAMNQISNSIDGAISRFDTLNNFPKVMSNLGIGTEQADKSIKKMSDKLSGLPTTLDQGAMAVQRFTSANSNIEKSTNIFLALNNAILAGGASSEIQANALEQLSQAYAKGKPDMMEWRTAMTAMPAQLKQVAKAMGYVSADELGAELREGTVSMDEFMDTIIKLNEEGIDGFQTFEEQARNSTGGIATSITNAKTQIVKGVTDILTALNKSFEKTRFGSLSNFISEIGKKAKEGLDEIAKLISGELSLLDFGKEITEIINKTIIEINNNFPRIFNKGVDLVIEFAKGITSGNSIQTLISNVTDLMLTIITTIVEKLPDIVNLGADIIYKLIDGISLKLPDLANKIIELTNIMIEKFNDPAFQQKLVETGTKIIISLMIGIIKTLPKIISIINNFKGDMYNSLFQLPQKMVEIGKNIIIGIINGIKAQKNKLISEVKNLGDNIVNSIKKKLKISSPSKLLADSVGKFIPSGIAVGIEANTDSITKAMDDMYREMNNAIKVENSKLSFDVVSGNVYNKSFFQTPVQIDLNADVEMDSQKVGRLVTPSVTRTIKNGGGV